MILVLVFTTKQPLESLSTLNPILYVEDEEDDAFLIRRAFEKSEVRNPITVVEDGRAAIRYLSGQSPYDDRRHFLLPCAVITDLRMPGMDGYEFLAWVRRQERFAELPVIILSSSVLDSERSRVLELGATAYRIKPLSHSGLVEIVREIHETWIKKAIPLLSGSDLPEK